MSAAHALTIDSHAVRREGSAPNERWCLTDLWRATVAQTREAVKPAIRAERAIPVRAAA